MVTKDNLSRETLNLIYNNTNDLIFLIDVVPGEGYRCASVNQAYLDRTGYRPDQLVGRMLGDFLPAEEYAYVAARYEETIASNGPYTYETRTDLSGQTAYIETTLVPVYDANGDCTNLIGVSRDITEQKREKQALKEEKQRAENYLNITEALIVALDRDANIQMMNRKGYTMLGYPEGSLTGESWPEHFLPEDKRAKFRNNYREALEVGTVGENVNYVVTRAGKKVLIKWSNAVIRNEKGEATGVLSSGEDITERRQAEKALIASQRVLAAGEVVSAVAHDFNNALQGILGNIELALANPGLPPEIIERLKIATDLADDAARRIELLQRFATASPTRDHAPVELSGLIEDVIAQTRHLWRDDALKAGRVIDIKRTGESKPCYSTGNAGELRSVLYNIVKNSIEAMPRGGTIDIALSTENDANVITVTDTGEGMDEQTSTRVFQPFFSTKGLEAGRGLGMSASHSIIVAHGGSLVVTRSVPGAGTTLEIRLPRSAAPDAVHEADDDDAAPRAHHILWVDDDPEVRRLATRYLEALGHSGDVAESAEQALTMIEAKSYSHIITDVGMPGMNGFEFAKELRNRGYQIPVIALTGWGESAGGAEAGNVVSLVLAKPIRIQALAEALDQLA
ncbi:MAG: PAS domain S-box protein [Pseudomonadales bacterium]|nr:PAS domain S-box protein [Pseudomonadales bacterium]